jgi:hypothetical protein
MDKSLETGQSVGGQESQHPTEKGFAKRVRGNTVKKIATVAMAGALTLEVGSAALGTDRVMATESSAPTATSSTQSFANLEYGGAPYPWTDMNNSNLSYQIAARWAWETGVMQGYEVNGQKEFRPNSELTREQAAKIMVETLVSLDAIAGEPASNSNPFEDVDKSSKFFQYIAVAKEYGLVYGVDGKRFDPYGKVTGDQFISMATRAARLLIKGEVDKGRILNVSRDMDEEWDPHKPITRAQATRIACNTYYYIGGHEGMGYWQR